MTRIITDPSELDALPTWAVVEDVRGIAWVRHPGTPDRADHWMSYYGDRISTQYVAARGPLTVLGHPEEDVMATITTTDIIEAIEDRFDLNEKEKDE